MTALHVVVTQAITEDEARARLRVLGPKAIKAARLAREWGWSRWKARQFIEACRAEGVIPPNTNKARPKAKAEVTAACEADSNSVIAHEASAESKPQGSTQMTTTQSIHSDEVPPHRFTDSTPPKDATELSKRKRYSLPPPPPDEPVSGKAIALILGITAVVLGGIGLVLNVTFAQSLGSTPFAALLLAVVGGMIDVVTILLPSVAGRLWKQRQFGPALGAWALWCAGLAMTLIAACGFAATNIGDSGQGRLKVTDERAELTAKLDNLHTQRSKISETRSPASIESAIELEKPRIPAANWKASNGCTDVTSSGKACKTINTLRQAKTDAVQRDQLDADITNTENALKALPAYAVADPGADMGAKIVTAASFGLIKLTPETIQQTRIAGLTVAPGASGLLLFFAVLAWRPRRDEFLVPSLV